MISLILISKVSVPIIVILSTSMTTYPGVAGSSFTVMVQQDGIVMFLPAF